MLHNGENFESIEIADYLERLTAVRQGSQDGWYYWQGPVNDHWLRIKGYKTWLQIAEQDGIKFSFGMDIPVKKWRENLVELAGIREIANY
jgi:hypothetical protein